MLTFLFREMQGLIEAGYVYIAKPPLYTTSGDKEMYIEKEMQLEEMLLRDKLEKIQVFDRTASSVQAHPAALADASRLLKQYEGWASTLRAEYGHPAITWSPKRSRRSSTRGSTTIWRRSPHSFKKDAPKGEPFDAEVLSGQRRLVKAIERKTGLATTHQLAHALFESRASTGSCSGCTRSC